MALRCVPRILRVVAVAAVASCAAADAPPDSSEVAVHVGSVGLDPRSGAPVVVLAEDGGSRSLPIWVGFAEAASIAAEIAHDRPPRPNTHDLLLQVIADLDGRVERVVVTELRDGTYFARLHVTVHGRSLELDARPSDAVALALRAHAPVFVREALFDAAHETPEGGDAPGREASAGAPASPGPARS